MVKWLVTLFFFLCTLGIHCQNNGVPLDYRQHNLTEYNSSFFNPVLSFYGNNPQSLAFWSRWQWQQLDADPSTLFLNYTRQINEESAAGLGFFQHNTGIFINTGGVLNYAYIYEVSPELKIGVGLNLFGFKQIVADNALIIDSQIELPQLRSTNDFILQAAPGIFVKLKNLGIGFTSENLFDYNFTLSERQSSPEERIYLFSTAYDFHLFSNSAVLRPMVYWKSVPFEEDQLGLTTLFSTDKYWAQAGYNDFYGVSVGGGGRFLKKVSIGALVEFATDSSLDGIDPTFELVAAYHFGKQYKEEKEEQPKEELIVEQEEEAEETEEAEVIENKTLEDVAGKTEKRRQQKEQEALKQELREAQRQAKQQQKDSVQQAEKAQELADKLAQEQAQLEAERLEGEKEAQRQREAIETKQRLDSISQATLAINEERARQQQIDSLRQIEIATERLMEKRQQDSLANLDSERIQRKKNALAAQKRLDSMNQLKTEQPVVKTQEAQEEVVLEKNEKYEEVATEGGLTPGFYLITNVFGTKKYYEAFMQDLTKRGLQPKSFLRSQNNYQYVYLERYNTMAEAREARNSKFFGKYTDAIWIFRVVGE